jgi:hypothetical protein
MPGNRSSRGVAVCIFGKITRPFLPLTVSVALTWHAKPVWLDGAGVLPCFTLPLGKQFAELDL